ncbi:MAG TPA: hypothetical protein VKY92_10005 [Verrucomicrobiae bacterium]|nr:hypothetical protein [Verrucomicrobiae bacterium]
MPRPLTLLGISLGALTLICSCNKKEPQTTSPSTSPGPTAAFFKTPFQDESQFIVWNIVSDLAQQMYYAARQQTADSNEFRVTVTEKKGSLDDSPEYSVQVRFDSKLPELSSDLSVNGPLWSPGVYRELAAKLAQAAGLKPSQQQASAASLLPKLSELSAELLAREDTAVSALLEKDYRNGQSHEKAALLLGIFMFREHSGHFFEIRQTLCQMTVHLAMAHFLEAPGTLGINGQIAEATLLTLVNAEKAAVEKLDAITSDDPEAVALARALRCRATGDYRLIDALKVASRIERVEFFCAKAGFADTAPAWGQVTRTEKRTVDFVRTATQQRYSVQMGHEFLETALPLEMQEINTVYEVTHNQKLKPKEMPDALNEWSTGGFAPDASGKIHPQVIGWGQWAAFLQRHLCHAVQQNYYFLAKMLGAPDEAKQFAGQAESQLSGLRLYPFVRRFTCSTEAGYHKALDDGFPMTIATPHLVPADCWSYLCNDVDFAPPYMPIPNPHLNQWYRHVPPPGTAYDLNPRLHIAALHSDPDALSRMEKLHQLAPYDPRIDSFIWKVKYQETPTHDQVMDLYSPVLPYSVLAMRRLADTVKNRPEDYEKLMIPAAKLDPACYYDLGNYFIEQNNEQKAASYFDLGCEADPDAVRASNYAVWRVRHLLHTGEIEKARAVADEAGDVYSYVGLEAKAVFMEDTTNYQGAFEWYSKIDERYNAGLPLVGFCLRYEGVTGDHKYRPEVEKRLRALFPKGVEKVTLSNFHIAPPDGVLITQENDALRAAGLKKGDVIVAVNGIRVHSMLQYMYGRDLNQTPELDLIVWQGEDYHEFKPSVPNHKFGVPFDDYVRRRKGQR